MDTFLDYLEQLTIVLEAWPRLLERKRRNLKNTLEEKNVIEWRVNEAYPGIQTRGPIQYLRLLKERPSSYHVIGEPELPNYYIAYRVPLERSIALEKKYKEPERRRRLESEARRMIGKLNATVLFGEQKRRFLEVSRKAIEAIKRNNALITKLDEQLREVEAFDPVIHIMMLDPKYMNTLFAGMKPDSPFVKTLSGSMTDRRRELFKALENIDYLRELIEKLNRDILIAGGFSLDGGPEAEHLALEKEKIEEELKTEEDLLEKSLRDYRFSEAWMENDYGVLPSVYDEKGELRVEDEVESIWPEGYDDIDDREEWDMSLDNDYEDAKQEYDEFERRFGEHAAPHGRWERRWVVLEEDLIKPLNEKLQAVLELENPK